jgi:hypothetical protein
LQQAVAGDRGMLTEEDLQRLLRRPPGPGGL